MSRQKVNNPNKEYNTPINLMKEIKERLFYITPWLEFYLSLSSPQTRLKNKGIFLL